MEKSGKVKGLSKVFVGENGKKGVKSPDGDIIVPANYDEIKYAYNYPQLAKISYVATRNGKMGLVSPDGSGNEVTPFLYDDIIFLFTAGCFVCRKEGSKKLGILWYNGNEIMPCNLDSCDCSGQTIYFSRDNHQGLLQTEIGVLLEPIYDDIQIEDPEEPSIFTLNGVKGYVKSADKSFIPETMSKTMDEDDWHDLLLECICDMYND